MLINETVMLFLLPIIELCKSIKAIQWYDFWWLLAGLISHRLSACTGNVVHNTYNTTGTRALPNIYAQALRPTALGPVCIPYEQKFWRD